MSLSVRAVLGLGLVLAAGAPAAADQVEELTLAVGRLRGQLAGLEALLRQREESLEGLRKELRAVADEVGGMKDRPAAPLSGPFLAAPPPSSDTVGVARVAVFAPRLDLDSTRRHDALFLKVRRIEAVAIRVVAETEMGSDQTSTDLPIDQNGGLYIVEWSTSEGHNYSLVLRDGASNQPAATVQVKPLQNQGRFIFVGYRVE